jgi:hypothetical protein
MDDYNDLHRMQFDLETTDYTQRTHWGVCILELNRKERPLNIEDLTKLISSNNTPLRHSDSRYSK